MNERTTLEKIAPTVDEAVADGLAELGLISRGCGCGRSWIMAVAAFWGWQPPGACPPDGKRTYLLNLGTAQHNQYPSRGMYRPPPRWRKFGRISEEAFSVLDDNLLFVSRQTVAELLEKMKIPAHIEVRYGEPDEEGKRPVMVDVQGDDLGVLIGRRAEILNALQYITNLIVSKQVERWVQVIIDVQGYRARHERQLRQMAQRMADQAMKAGRRQVLEPMSASDRRIIHLELRDHPSVTTQSVGEEPTRKVTIVPKE